MLVLLYWLFAISEIAILFVFTKKCWAKVKLFDLPSLYLIVLMVALIRSNVVMALGASMSDSALVFWSWQGFIAHKILLAVLPWIMYLSFSKQYQISSDKFIKAFIGGYTTIFVLIAFWQLANFDWVRVEDMGIVRLTSAKPNPIIPASAVILVIGLGLIESFKFKRFWLLSGPLLLFLSGFVTRPLNWPTEVNVMMGNALEIFFMIGILTFDLQRKTIISIKEGLGISQIGSKENQPKKSEKV